MALSEVSPERERSKSDLEGSESDLEDEIAFELTEDEMSHIVPFLEAHPALDGNFYPRDSKRWPVAPADDPLVKVADGPPTSPVSPGTAEAGADSWDDKSFRENSAHGPR
jgi:hypothetical protein